MDEQINGEINKSMHEWIAFKTMLQQLEHEASSIENILWIWLHL